MINGIFDIYYKIFKKNFIVIFKELEILLVVDFLVLLKLKILKHLEKENVKDVKNLHILQSINILQILIHIFIRY